MRMTKKILAVALGLISSSLYGAEEVLARLAIAQGIVETHAIYQLPVVNQHRPVEGLSTTNCGAHTFRNGLIIAEALKDEEKLGRVLEELHSIDDIREKFQHGGTWTFDNGQRLSWLEIGQVGRLFGEILVHYNRHFATYGYETLARRFLDQSDEDARRAMEGAIQNAHFPSQKNLPAFYERYHEQEQFVGVIGIYLQDYRNDIFNRLVTAGYETLYDWKTLLFGGKDAYEQHIYSRTKGHWITLVVVKKGDHTFFVTTDSSGNTIRIANEKISEVAQLLGADNLYQAYEDRYLAQATELAQRLEDRYVRSKKLLVAALVMAIGYWFLKEQSPRDSSPEKPDVEELLPIHTQLRAFN